MPLVLAIEPDLRQAAIVKRIVREKVRADVAVVDSRDAALEAMRTTVPDVLLISALLSPRDEDELIAHLRTLDDADHLQTHTIPQLASALGPGERRVSRGLLSAFRRKKEPEAAPSGCDPDIFAEEIRAYLQRAAEKKRERLDVQTDTPPKDHAWRKATHGEKVPEPVAGPPAPEESTSSWSSPFEWKPTNPSSLSPDPESAIASPESEVAEPVRAAVAEEAVISVQAEEPVQASVPIAAPIQDGALIPIQDSASIQDPRSVIRDARSGLRDQRLGIRDRAAVRLGPLATWARSENRGRDAAHGRDDLRGLLSGLAVPSAVVAVGYGRGCRIRRVRVPAAREPREPKDAETVGAVIRSRRLLAEQRERREQPPA